MSVGRFLQQAAAGNAGEAVYVDDVFSTYLYEGNGSSKTITNGIDLAGEGGMVWTKDRTITYNHSVRDSVRGGQYRLMTNLTNSQADDTTTGITSFNSDGYTHGSQVSGNYSGSDYVSWTFRKQPGFFDIVTYTGNGSSGVTRTLSHNLGSVPGMIIVKSTTQTSNWAVYHRGVDSSSPENYNLYLDATNGRAISDLFGSTAPTDTEFTVGWDSDVNTNGQGYVAYLFAHDAQDFGTDSDESIIKCGSFTGNATVDLGFEPQWVMIKRTDNIGNWFIQDSMRGIPTGGLDTTLFANLTSADNTSSDRIDLTSTGFIAKYGTGAESWIYIAIRRPHKPAEEFAATDLFTTVVGSGNPGPNFVSGFPVDMFWQTRPASSDTNFLSSRLIEGKYLGTNSANAEVTSSYYVFDYQNGVTDTVGFSTNRQAWMFRRAPGFFDVVAYTGDGVNGRAIDHNLGAVPQLIIVKARNQADDWTVYSEPTGNDSELYLNFSYAASAFSSMWYDTDPTETQFTVGSDSKVNRGGGSYTYIAYLFATAPGISKVGSYSGTGSDVDVDCGFTSGARFVLVKRTDSTGDWYLWDSVRGIVAGNDPYLLLNSTAAQVTSTDYIDPLSSGFTITSSAPAALNASGGSYIFLAIA